MSADRLRYEDWCTTERKLWARLYWLAVGQWPAAVADERVAWSDALHRETLRLVELLGSGAITSEEFDARWQELL